VVDDEQPIVGCESAPLNPPKLQPVKIQPRKVEVDLSFLSEVVGNGFQWRYVDAYRVPCVRQAKGAECGPCCVGLILRLIKHDGADAITPAMLRAESQRYARGYRPYPGDVIPGPTPDELGATMGKLKEGMNDLRPLATPDEKARLGWPAPGEDTQFFGSSLANLEQMLNGYGCQDTTLHWVPSLMPLLGLTSIARPLIVAIRWRPNGRHFVVVCGHRQLRRPRRLATDNPMIDEYLFSDPAYGVGWLTVTSNQVYVPQSGIEGDLTGDYLSPTW